jgi:Carboxypeptidase regulatory-like domain
MKRLIAVVVFVLFLMWPVFVIGQVINATLSGTVSDTSGALIPGVEVTAKNTDTGVVSTSVTNEAGTYRFGSLQPGPYEVSAQLTGFQGQSFRLTLGTSQQIRQNFSLQVGAVAQNVDVSIAADQLLTTVASSVGNVLPEKQVVDLPLVGRNVMDLAIIMPGVVGNGNSNTTFAGISAGGSGNVNLQLDGVTVNNGRHTQGLAAATTITPDIVEEVRVVVAAVDVESRGSAQIQVRTRSGTNQFHGSAVWNARNSAFNANTWANNRQGIAPTWYNRHQYTATLGGPIIRNKTFFFGFFDGQKGLQKQSVDAVVLTDPARQGIFRFFPGVNNGNADATPSGSGNTRVAPVVDRLGNPLDWTRISGATGPMQSFNVFGDALNPGDPLRRQMDPTVFMQKLLTYMPRANAFDGPSTVMNTVTSVPVDGLNTAIHRWTRRTVAATAGTGENPDAFRRHQYSIKIDHNFNSHHKLTGNWTEEHRYSDNNALSAWPTGWNGELITDPSVKTIQLTSTLSPTILNEFRFGRRVTTLHSIPAYHASTNGKEAWDFMTVINNIPVMQHPTLFQDHVIACSGYCADFGNKSPLSTYTETLSWTKGAHALKVGAEFRYASTFGWAPNVIIPHAYGGQGDVSVKGIDTVPGLANSNITLAQNLLLSLSGSVNDTRERFEIREPSDTRFLDFRDTYFNAANPKNTYGRIRDWHQNEFNAFIKDDWKITPNFTLNVGIRYDLMRVPYLLSANGKGFTPGLVGGNNAIFGYSGRSFGDWMSGGTEQKGDLTQTTLIGPGTNNPKQGIWPSDKNNFAPAVGFAWSPKWWGQDKTTIRGGYQIAYQLPGNSLSWIDVDAGNLPGFFYEPTDLGNGTFRDFSNITIPLAVNQKPFDTIPITQRAQATAIFDANYTTPYVQTFTLGVTRSLASNVTLDVRYIGTRGVRLPGSYNLNDAEIRKNGLFDALEITRAGGDAALFDRMLKGLNFGSGIGVVGVDVSGSEALRKHASFRTDIANGNYVVVARTLSTTNIGTVQPPLTNAGLLRSSGLFPPNFIVTNPQFGNITYRTNSDSSNYHSLQTQVTLRSTHGVQYQATYTWSKSLGIDSGGSGALGTFRDLQNRRADYALLSSHRAHDFRSYGTFELPFGPGKLVGGSVSNWVARIIEGWKVGTIFNLTSGAPMNIVGGNTLYGLGTQFNGTPDVVGDFPRKTGVVWPLKPGDAFGNLFGQQFKQVKDPACASVAPGLVQWCTLNALADVNGNIVLRNAAPGQLGTLGLRPIEGFGSRSFDANVQKTIRIRESKTVTFRLDANNVLNHPNPGVLSPLINPVNLNINSGTFGEINSKNGSRTLQALLRFDF